MNRRLARLILYMFEDDGELRLTYNGVARALRADPEETKDTLHALVDSGKLDKYCEFYYRNLAYVNGRPRQDYLYLTLNVRMV